MSIRLDRSFGRLFIYFLFVYFFLSSIFFFAIVVVVAFFIYFFLSLFSVSRYIFFSPFSFAYSRGPIHSFYSLQMGRSPFWSINNECTRELFSVCCANVLSTSQHKSNVQMLALNISPTFLNNFRLFLCLCEFLFDANEFKLEYRSFCVSGVIFFCQYWIKTKQKEHSSKKDKKKSETRKIHTDHIVRSIECLKIFDKMSTF